MNYKGKLRSIKYISYRHNLRTLCFNEIRDNEFRGYYFYRDKYCEDIVLCGEKKLQRDVEYNPILWFAKDLIKNMRYCSIKSKRPSLAKLKNNNNCDTFSKYSRKR